MLQWLLLSLNLLNSVKILLHLGKTQIITLVKDSSYRDFEQNIPKAEQ